MPCFYLDLVAAALALVVAFRLSERFTAQLPGKPAQSRLER
jgi:hypothetical protein